MNTASRMESNSIEGRLHCTNTSAQLLLVQAPDLPLVCRGKINVKGKLTMPLFGISSFG